MEEIKVRLDLLTEEAQREVKKFGSVIKGETKEWPVHSAKASKGFAGLGRSAMRNLGPAGVAGLSAAAGAAFVAFTKRSIRVGSEFEKQLSDLSAITGITGEGLQDLGSTAVRESVRSGVAAKDQVESLKLVASQLADSIDFDTSEGQAALKAVAQDAITLSRAAGIDLAQATQVATSAINQFGLDAEDSRRVINSLAAGSKFGAAEVGNIGAAMKEAGAGFAAADQPIEAANAGIQILAQNSITGAQAGTGLRNMITILQTETQKLADAGITDVNVKSEGFAATLNKLTPLLDDTTALTDIFGRENLNAAQILIKNADAVANMQEKVTGTNTAIEQANVQTNNLATDTEKLTAAIDRISIAFFDRLVPGLRSSAQFFTSVANSIADLITPSEEISSSFMNFREEVGRLSGSVPSLLDEYDNLLTKSEDNEEAQIRLKEIVGQLKDSLPGAAVQFNDLGEAIGISTEQARQYVEQQQELLKIRNEDEIEDQVESIALLEKQWNGLLNVRDKLASGQVVQGVGSLDDVNAEIRDIVGNLKLSIGNLEELGLKGDDLKKTIDGWSFGAGFYEVNLEEIITRTGFLTKETEATAAGAGEFRDIIAEIEGIAPPELPDFMNSNAEGKEAVSVANDYESQLKAIQDEYDQIINKAGELTSAETNRLKSLDAQQRYLENIKKLREAGFSRADLPDVQPAGTRINAGGVSDESDGEQLFGDTEEGQDMTSTSYLDELMRKEDEYTAAAEANAQQRAAARAQEWQQGLQAAAGAISNIVSLQQAQTARRVSQIQRETDERLSSIDIQLQNEELSEEQRTALIQRREEIEASSEARVRKVKRENAKSEKRWLTAQAIANTAVAVTQSLPNLVLAGIAAASGAIQIATIQQQPIPYRDGGMVPVDVSNGEMYIPAAIAEKNMPALEAINRQALQPGKIRGAGTGTSDSIKAVAEQGSFILNAEATKLIEKSVASSSSTSISSESNRFADTNSTSMERAMTYRDGGMVGSSNFSTSTVQTSAPVYQSQERDRTIEFTPVIEELKGLRADIQGLEIETNINLRDLNIRLKKVEKVESQNRVEFS